MKKALCVSMTIGLLLVGSLPVAAETYTLGSLPRTMWSYYKVAEVKGFWEKQGVTVKILDFTLVTDLFRAAIQRRFDLVPLPLAITATYWDEGTDILYLGTFSIADHHKCLIIKKDLVKKSLKGQRVGIFNPDLANIFLLSSYLNTVNTDLADVQLVQMITDDLETTFIHNRLQAVLTLDQGNTFYEQADGLIVASTQDFYEPHGLGLLTQGGIPPEDLKKIMRGCVEAIVWIRDPANWEEYKAILKKHFFVDLPDLSDDQIRAFLQEGKIVAPQTLLDHNQQQLTDYFTQFRAFSVAEGLVKEDVLKDFTYDNVIYNQALIEVLQEYVQ